MSIFWKHTLLLTLLQLTASYLVNNNLIYCVCLTWLNNLGMGIVGGDTQYFEICVNVWYDVDLQLESNIIFCSIRSEERVK